MDRQSTTPIRLSLTYDGAGPVFWSGGPADFGLQDKDGVLHLGAPTGDGAQRFDLALTAKPAPTGARNFGAPVFTGPFAHGPPAERFLYLSWRNPTGGFAQRLKIPLTPITWDQIREAQAAGRGLSARLVDHQPRATSTGANIGGTREVEWRVG